MPDTLTTMPDRWTEMTEELNAAQSEPDVIFAMSKCVEALRFDAIPAIAVLAGRKKNEGAAFTLRHLRSLVDEYDAALAAALEPHDA